MYHECEKKFKINDKSIVEALKTKAIKYGYNLIDSRIETDYIIDTPKLVFEKNLFRVREINKDNKKTLLYTVKIKGTSLGFQDYTEYEITPKEDSDLLINRIQVLSGITLEKETFKCEIVTDALRMLQNKGFIIKRIYQKKREVYSGKIAKVLFDIFPQPVGIFLEIESENEKHLDTVINQLNLGEYVVETRNYGQIIREATQENNLLLFIETNGDILCE